MSEFLAGLIITEDFCGQVVMRSLGITCILVLYTYIYNIYIEDWKAHQHVQDSQSLQIAPATESNPFEGNCQPSVSTDPIVK
jgi:hypothetical protein